ncbi:MAG: hypothetical protein JO107_10260 [Hyphomicrobiales bacterium]|nr:hypothetical protein [Hyphomicrobiales bacterium]MBV8663473.1 hypothetical protein [Hyphomicrobiales bacterium]
MDSTQPYRTSSDLVLKTLSILGVLAAGQSVDPEDFATVNDNLDSIFRKLSALEICYVPDPDNIPGEWFMDLAAIVAGEVATDFGAGPDTLPTLVNRGLGGFGNVPIGAGTAAQSLKIMLRGRPTGEPLRTDSF